MKTILSLVLFVFMFSSASFSQTINSCNPFDCSTIPFTSDSKTFTMPGYPTCPITVYFLRRICNGKEEIEIQTIGYNNPPSPLCSGLVSWLTDPLHSFDNLNLLWSTSRQEIATQLFTAYYASLPSQTKFLVECPNGYKNYDYYTSVCNHYCSYVDAYHGMFQFAQLPCSTTQCCKVEYTVCWNTTTSQMDVVKTTTQTGGTTVCESTAPACPATLPVPGAFVVGTQPSPMTLFDYETSSGNTCE